MKFIFLRIIQSKDALVTLILRRFEHTICCEAIEVFAMISFINAEFESFLCALQQFQPENLCFEWDYDHLHAQVAARDGDP
jgi:hypothetical protein